MKKIENELFQTTVLTFNKNRITSDRPSGNRLSPWGTMHLLTYLAILTDLESGKLSPDKPLYFSIESEKEFSAIRSTQGQVGEKRLLRDVLNQAISLNAPDCIVSLFDVYGGLLGTQRRINEYWYASNYSKKSATGRKKYPQLSNLFDYYKIGEAFLHLKEETFSYIKNKNHFIHDKWHLAQSSIDGKDNILASIYWGTDQNDCLMFFKENAQLSCSLVINGDNYFHTTEVALNATVKHSQSRKVLEENKINKHTLEQKFRGHFLNRDLAQKIVVEHTVCDQSSILRNKWKNVAYIALSSESHNSMIPSAKRTFHGNDLISRFKLEKYLSVIITDEPIPHLKDKIPQFIVPNSLAFAYEYASYQMRNYKGKFCTITGSAGKSSTRLILSHLLSSKGKVFENFGNSNSHYSTFSLSQEISNRYDFILFEASVASMNRLGYGNCAYMWRADVAIVTSIGSAHAVSGIERNLMIKEQLFQGVKNNGHVVINKDIEKEHLENLIQRAESLSLKTLFCSLNDSTADCYLLEKKVLKDKTDIRIAFRGREINFSLSTDSDGQIQNAMSALLAIDVMGYRIEEYVHLLESYRSLERILRPIKLKLDSKTVTVIDDTHNSSIESMINGIKHFGSKKSFYKGRKLLVLGEVADLGNDAIKHHKRLIPYIKKVKPDHVILYGEPFKKLSLDVESITLCETKEEVVEKIIKESSEDSLIFVKGSHGIGFYDVIEKLNKRAETV